MMEESNQLKSLYSFLQAFVYFLLILEFVVWLDIWKDSIFVVRLSRLLIYKDIYYTKLFTFMIVLITSVGTLAKKDLKLNTRNQIIFPIFFGFFFFFFSFYVLHVKGEVVCWRLNIPELFYMILTTIGLIFMHIGFDNISKLIKSNLMKDKFNIENESFEQSKNKIETEYSINLPMSFYFNKKRHKGWFNIVNPFRGTLLTGVPGTGKSYAIVENFIRQLAAKGFSLVVYDYKYPDLSGLTYYHFLLNKQKGILPPTAKFNVVNFNDCEFSVRLNPLKCQYIKKLADAVETAETLVESLKKGADESGGADKFFTQSAVNFLASIIYFFSKYKDGVYSDLPHVLSFLNKGYEEIFTVLFTDPELTSLLSPFQTAFNNKAFEQLEGQIGTLKVQISRLATKESFWILTEDKTEESISLKISDKDNPSYLVIANSPETENINSALNALVLNRLSRLINSRGNLPSAIIIDELPTLYFHKIDNLIATARSNKVAVLLALQDLPQLRKGYGKGSAEVVTSITGNVISSAVRDKTSLDWLEKIFGKVKQQKEGLSIDRNRSTVSFNESMDYLIPASKIAALKTGEFVAQVATDFGIEDFDTTMYNCRIELNNEYIAKEKSKYPQCPKTYNFGDDKESLLLLHYKKINDEVQNLINEFQGII